jgi:NAD(P)-dependent dehydrogenase (short-subunit alcohol dehydrogenase family)
MSQLARFASKVAIVTGAASGIGQATLVRLVSEGAIAIGVDVNETGLLTTLALAEKQATAEGRASSLVASVSNEADVKRVVRDVVQHEGRLDVLVNVAGILRSSATTETTLEQFLEPINVNLVGTFLFCREALPHLLKTHGNVVNTASTSAFFGQPYMVGYSASKGAVVSLTRALAWEYLHQGIRVNAVAPGGIDTPLTQNQRQNMEGFDRSLFGHMLRPDFMLGQPAQVASVIAMLASDDGAFMTGEVVKIDGGVHN